MIHCPPFLGSSPKFSCHLQTSSYCFGPILGDHSQISERNNGGPNTDPCGTPRSTAIQLERLPFTCILSFVFPSESALAILTVCFPDSLLAISPAISDGRPYSEILVEKRSFTYLSVSRMTPSECHQYLWLQRTRVPKLRFLVNFDCKWSLWWYKFW